VGYEVDHRLALADHLAELTPLERANLVADTWATTLAGHSTLREFLLLAAKLELEPDPTPWAPVSAALHLVRRIVTEADLPALRRMVAALVGPQFHHLGFEAQPGEGERTPTLRSLAINLMGTVGDDAGVRAEAARRFDASPLGGGDGDPIPADVESATLAVVAQLLRPGDYDALLERYRAASTPQEEMRSLNALSAFPDIALALRTFDLAMTEVRSQNGWIVISALLANPVAGQAAWGRISESIPALCGDAGFAAGVVQFLKDHPLASGPRRVAQSVERLGVNVAFADRERDRLADSLGAVIATSGTA